MYMCIYFYISYISLRILIKSFTALLQANLNKANEEQESLSPQLHDHNSAPFDDNDAEFFGDGKYYSTIMFIFHVCMILDWLLTLPRVI